MNKDVELAKKYITKATRAEKANIDFELSFFEYKKLMNRKTCAYSGLVFSEVNEKNEWKHPWQGRTIDRIDNSKGYISGNVVAVCNGVNKLKSQWEDPNLIFDANLTLKIIKNAEKYLKKSTNC
jgi:hypothetical protein